MSDAMSDIARDEKRYRSCADYFDKVKEYLEHPTKKNLKIAIKAAGVVDSIPNGYFYGQTSFVKDAKKNLKNLRFWVECGVVEVRK